MSKTLEIIVDPAGRLSIDAVGFSGTDCEQATAFLEQGLGVVQEKRRKPEYHRRRIINHVQKLGR